VSSKAPTSQQQSHKSNEQAQRQKTERTRRPGSAKKWKWKRDAAR